MARTIEEIYNEMATEKNNFSVLNQLQPNIDDFQSMLTQLSTTSKVAIWRLMIYIVAVGIWALEKSFDLHKAWIINRALEIQTGTVFWYASKCLDFQYGDAIQWNGSNYQYPTINEAIKIVKLVSVREVGTKVVIKVANLIGSNAVPLTIGELTALTSYLNQVKFAGVQLLVVSRPADLLKLAYTVYYDPQVIAADGSLISNPSIRPVDDAINAYLLRLPFDGILNLTHLTDTIQNSVGVIDPIINSAEAKYGVNTYAPVINNYQANAGHMIIDPLFPLTTSITYISQND